MPAFIGFSAPGGVDGGPDLRQRPGTCPELLLSLHLSHVPFHLKASEPLHIAWEVVIRAHALLFVGGGIRRQVLDDLIARLLLGVVACIDRKSTRLNSSHLGISYAVFCLKKKNNIRNT